jgi:hypothetical protein
MDSPSFGSLGTNNVLVGTRIHGMSVATLHTAETAALAGLAKYRSNVDIQRVRLGVTRWSSGPSLARSVRGLQVTAGAR